MIGNVDLDLVEKTYQNAHMGITAIEEVLDKANNMQLKQDLEQQLKDYEEIANHAKQELDKHNVKAMDTSTASKMMLKGNIKMNHFMDQSDSRIAEMVIKGSTMGITQMTKLLNDKPQADGNSVAIAKEFVHKEQHNIEVMKKHL